MSQHRPIRYAGCWARHIGLAVLFAVVCTGVGCQSGAKKGSNSAAAARANTPPADTPTADRYKVTADSTSFYLYGPQQPNGPDNTLKKDTRLTLVKRQFGYSRVKTTDGQTGYVGTEDIGPLTAQEIAEETSAVQLIPADVQKRMGPLAGGYTMPPEAGNDEHLPVADPTPKPTPPPPFRY